MKKIGIVGAGVMGRGLSISLLLGGHEVVLIDNNTDVFASALEEIEQGIRFYPMLNKKLNRVDDTEQFMKKITVSEDMHLLSECEFIIENVTENEEIKKDVYKQLDEICDKNACFAVNTSCVSVTKIGSYTNRADKIIGIHFMNPVPLMECSEVIKGWYTSGETIETAKALLADMGKEYVLVNDMPGFVSNRISHIYMNEAAYVVQDKVASPKEVDDIFKKCFSNKMGPLETIDLIGVDTVVNSLNVLYENYHDPKYRVCPLLNMMVNAGKLGRKSKEGFYKY